MSEITLAIPLLPLSAPFDLSQKHLTGMKRFVARLLARHFMTFGDLNQNEMVSLSLKRKIDLHVTYLGIIPKTSFRHYRITRQFTSVSGETHEDISMTFFDTPNGWLPMIYHQAPIHFREIVRWFEGGELVMNVDKMRRIDILTSQWANILTRQAALRDSHITHS